MRYTVKTVVGGFHGIKKKEQWPFTILRTLIEHKQLGQIITQFAPDAKTSCELGCGFGRMLFALPGQVSGYERESTRHIAQKLFPQTFITNNVEELPEVDLLLTFTFLQHVPESELRIFTKTIDRIAQKYVILCEQVRGESRYCKGRTPFEYQALLPNFNLTNIQTRNVDHRSEQGDCKYMVFERKA